jgi:recombination protein RecT
MAHQGQQGGRSTALATPQKKMQELAGLIAGRRDAFALVAGKGFNPDRLVKLAQGALARTPKLAECHTGSVLVALMRCAELDLEPDSALAQRRMWLVPRWNSKIGGQECTYIIDYRAQLQKARETGLVTSIVAETVYEKDVFKVVYDVEGTSISKFTFEPGGAGGVFGDRGKVIGYFAAARLDGGEVQIVPMSVKQAEAHRDHYAPRKRDGSLASSPWTGGEDQFNAMACKTVLRRLFNLLPAGKTDAARKFQEQIQREAEIEDGKAATATIPVELDLGVPRDEEQGTDAAVEKQLTGKQEAPATEPKEPAKDEKKAPPAKREPGQEG